MVGGTSDETGAFLYHSFAAFAASLSRQHWPWWRKILITLIGFRAPLRIPEIGAAAPNRVSAFWFALSKGRKWGKRRHWGKSFGVAAHAKSAAAKWTNGAA